MQSNFKFRQQNGQTIQNGPPVLIRAVYMATKHVKEHVQNTKSNVVFNPNFPVVMVWRLRKNRVTETWHAQVFE